MPGIFVRRLAAATATRFLESVGKPVRLYSFARVLGVGVSARGGHNETETQFVSAEQTIHHSAKYPSHVLLPVIPE